MPGRLAITTTSPPTPSQPAHPDPQRRRTLPGMSPRSSRCPAKTTTASAPASTPSRSRESPGSASGDVARSTHGSCTRTSAPAASRNGSAGVFRASSEPLMNARA